MRANIIVSKIITKINRAKRGPQSYWKFVNLSYPEIIIDIFN